MARQGTLVNADRTADGIKYNPSADAGTVFALVELDDKEFTAAYKKAMAAGKVSPSVCNINWDIAAWQQVLQIASAAISKLKLPPTAEELKAIADAKAKQEAMLSVIQEPLDQVP